MLILAESKLVLFLYLASFGNSVSVWLRTGLGFLHSKTDVFSGCVFPDDFSVLIN